MPTAKRRRPPPAREGRLQILPIQRAAERPRQVKRLRPSSSTPDCPPSPPGELCTTAAGEPLVVHNYNNVAGLRRFRGTLPSKAARFAGEFGGMRKCCPTFGKYRVRRRWRRKADSGKIA